LTFVPTVTTAAVTTAAVTTAAVAVKDASVPGAKVTGPAWTVRAAGENSEGPASGLTGDVASAAIEATVTIVAVPTAAARVKRSSRTAPATRQ
jgi:hypothetical protein